MRAPSESGVVRPVSFGGRSPAEAGRRSGEVRRANAGAKRRVLERLSHDTTEITRLAQERMAQLPERGELVAVAVAVIMDMADRLLSGAVPIVTARDAAAAASVFARVAQLEPPAAYVGGAMTREMREQILKETKAKVRELRALREQKGGEATPAADDRGV